MSTDYNGSTLNPDEWISQAEAARIRGVTRQAISRLASRGRIRSITVAGRLLVSRADTTKFEPQTAGRPKRVRPE